MKRHKQFPKFQLFSELKNYNFSKFGKDVMSGIIVGIIALPLSIALAIKSGAGPEIGLLTAVVAGFTAAIFTGNKYQITGPTAAFVTIVLGIINDNGYNGLLTATFFAGILLLVMGLLRLGGLIRFINKPIITGFTTGIAVVLFIGQIPDFFGFKDTALPSEFIDKIIFIFKGFSNINLVSTAFGIMGLAIVLFFPKKWNKFVPGSLIAIIVSGALCAAFDPDINTIGKQFGVLELNFKFCLSFDELKLLPIIKSAVTIALLAAIESLLSSSAADGMTDMRSDPDAELISQGAANIASACLGGLPATGAIARTSANIKSGGQSPVAAIMHAVTILIISLVAMPLLAYIPLTTLAAILFSVCKNMINVKEIKQILSSCTTDIILFVVTMLLTVIFDLVVAIGVGVALNYVIILAIKIKNKEKKSLPFLFRTEKGTAFLSGDLTFLSDYAQLNEMAEYDGEPITSVNMTEVGKLDLLGSEMVEKILCKFRCREVVADDRIIKYLKRQKIVE